MRNLYPAQIAAAIDAFAPVSGVWASAAGLTLDDVRQELAAAVLGGLDPAAAVPRALGIRRVGGVWRSMDPTTMAAELSDFDVCVDDLRELPEDESGIAAALVGGTNAVAQRCGIGRRAAQMRVAAQAERFSTTGDLFCRGDA